MVRLAAVLLVSWAIAACGGAPDGRPLSATPLPVPAGPGGRFPYIATGPGERLHMVWLEAGAEGPARLLGAALEDGRWDDPRVLAEDEALFVNWADFPSLTGLGDGSLAFHWLQREGTRSYAYGIRFNVLSADWRPAGEPLRPHGDGTRSEHGFVSLIAEGEAGVGMAWLDGRGMEGPDGLMQLRYRRWSPGGMTEEIVLDPDVCSCCQTAGLSVGGEPFVVYRDRAEGEIRDISFVRRVGSTWSAPRTLHRDGWKIAGCPVNGPAADGRGDRVAVAWYTRAGDDPRVLLGVSTDGGERFGAPIRLDDGDPLGRVDVKLLPDGTAVVSWMEKVAAGAEIRIRTVDANQVPGSPLTVARTRPLRESGFPRLALSSDALFLAWTDATSPPAVKLARIDF